MAAKKTSMSDWILAMRPLLPDKAQELDEDRLIGFTNLEKYDLPRYARVMLPLSEYLADPEAAVAQLDSTEFYFVYLPRIKRLRRISLCGLNAQQMHDNALAAIPAEHRTHYDIFICEYWPNLIAGNIVIHPVHNTVYGEFKVGEHTGIPDGTVTPTLFVRRNGPLGSFKYSFEDPELRLDIWKALLSIPHSGHGRELAFTPGYYELIIVLKHGKHQPIFIEYRDHPGYMRLADASL